jgi:hypothetical protein
VLGQRLGVAPCVEASGEARGELSAAEAPSLTKTSSTELLREVAAEAFAVHVDRQRDVDYRPGPFAGEVGDLNDLTIGYDDELAGQHVLERPGVCLHRTTIAGRNFEYVSEDPY